MNPMFDQSRQWFEMWMDLVSKMATGAMAPPLDTPPPQAARQVRTAAFDAMSEYAERFMRSPQFMEMARQSLDRGLETREQVKEFLTTMRHELQGVARQDVESVLAAIHQMERRVMDRLDDIERRLNELAPDGTNGDGAGDDNARSAGATAPPPPRSNRSRRGQR